MQTDNTTTMSSEHNSKGTLLVIDGHSLLFRAFYALAADKFCASDGQATNAVYGFTSMLMKVLSEFHPDRLAISFDMKGGTFRHQLLKQYKGTRKPTPPELISQLPLLQQLLRGLGVAYFEKQGYEGDDILASLATLAQHEGYRTLILTGDRDSFQLIDDWTNVLYIGRHFSDLRVMDDDALVEKYNVSAKQYPDLAALCGEKSDNIPGVPGVGAGFAARWLNEYGSLQGIIEHADEIKGAKGQSLRDNIEQVQLNRQVNNLVRDLDIVASIDELTFGHPNPVQAGAVLARLEFSVQRKRKLFQALSQGGKASKDDVDTMLNTPSMLASATSLDNQEHATQTEDTDFSTWVESVEICYVHTSHELQAWADYMHHMLGDSARQALQATRETCANLIGSEHMVTLYVHPSTQQSRHTFGVNADMLMMLVGQKAALIVPQSQSASSAEMLDSLRQLLIDYAPISVLYDYKQQLSCLKALIPGLNAYEAQLPLLDTRLASYIVEPDAHSEHLQEIAKHFIDADIDADDDSLHVVQGELDLSFDEASDVAETQVNDEQELAHSLLRIVSAIRFLARYFAPILDEREQTKLMRDIELPTSRVLRGIEDVGAAVDMLRLHQLHDQFAADAQFAQNLAWQTAGKEINLQSPKQLQEVLFEDFQLRPTRRTKSGSYTTNAEVLQEMYAKLDADTPASHFLGALLQYRETNKLKQIVQTLIEAAHYQDGRIHTTYEQTIAATGRLSSTDPNLQNIPNRNAMGREIRSVFVPGNGYESLMSCDYSQVELRIMAHCSQDDSLIDAFRSGADFHRYVASMVYHIPIDEVSADQRSHVKAMSYGLAYGLSTYGLAKQLGIAPVQARALREEYFRTFGNVHDYLESLVAKARTLGYTQTLFGRRRYFPLLNSQNSALRQAAERGALNAPIQGSAADIMKIAMLRVDDQLRKHELKSRVILQIHDELVLEIAPGEQEQVQELVQVAMYHAADLLVPLDVATGVGANWQEAAH